MCNLSVVCCTMSYIGIVMKVWYDLPHVVLLQLSKTSAARRHSEILYYVFSVLHPTDEIVR